MKLCFMRCSICFLCLVVLFSLYTPAIHAQLMTLDERKVLLVYTDQDDTGYANLYLLDGTLSGLFDQVELVQAEQLTLEQLKDADVVVAYANTLQSITNETIERLNTFTGELVAIGEFGPFLTQFDDWTFQGKVPIRYIDGRPLQDEQQIWSIEIDAATNVLLEGRQFDKSYPLILKRHHVTYMNFTDLFNEKLPIMTAFLYDALQIKKPNEHYAYIRLEDISPVSDPQLMLEAGNYLLNRGIPVYLSLIPIYVNNKTGSTLTLQDVPQLMAVLDELVAGGAYIILHGYTHTYRYTEQGDGFEFWDAQMNQPITTIDSEDEPIPLKKQLNFSSEQAYEDYLVPFKEIESMYIHNKLTRAIHTLVESNYTPIAFEAPNYAMSANGYKITSSYFSSIFGQLQLSDEDWSMMETPLLVSRPSLLNGMVLYPETVGYVDASMNDPIQALQERMTEVMTVPGAMLGAYYHPYLGIDYLEEMVALFERIPNLRWLDVKDTSISVKTDKVTILMEDGQLVTNSTLSFKDDLKRLATERPLELGLWIMVFVTALFVGIFIFNIFLMRMRYRKRLFEERE